MFARHPVPLQAARVDREAEVLLAEAEAAALEAQTKEEEVRLRAALAEVNGRLQTLKAAAAQAQLSGVRDPQLAGIIDWIPGARPPELELARPRAEALEARARAAQARFEIGGRIRQQIQLQAVELSRRLEEIGRCNAVLQDLDRRAHEQRAQTQAQAEAQRRAATTPAPVPLAPDNRRQRPRVQLQTAVDLSSESNLFSGFSTDISVGGLFIATVQHAPIGTQVDLSFSLPSGEKVAAQGVVRWTREVNDSTPAIFPGLGVQFLALAEGSRAAIERFAAQREPMFFPD